MNKYMGYMLILFGVVTLMILEISISGNMYIMSLMISVVAMFIGLMMVLDNE